MVETWLAVPTYAAGRHGVLTAGVNVVCVQIKKGKAVDVQRMNISPDEKLSR